MVISPVLWLKQYVHGFPQMDRHRKPGEEDMLLAYNWLKLWVLSCCQCVQDREDISLESVCGIEEGRKGRGIEVRCRGRERKSRSVDTPGSHWASIPRPLFGIHWERRRLASVSVGLFTNGIDVKLADCTGVIFHGKAHAAHLCKRGQQPNVHDWGQMPIFPEHHQQSCF